MVNTVEWWPQGPQDILGAVVPLTFEQGATLSMDGRYRFTLTRQIDVQTRDKGAVTFLMLNPSTADAQVNDPTIKRCIQYAHNWGYHWLYVVNLSPFRATDPKDLKSEGNEPDLVWATNIAVIQAAAHQADLLVAAYGVKGRMEDRATRVLENLNNHDIYCLKKTKNGYPCHPLQRTHKSADIMPTLYRDKDEG